MLSPKIRIFNVRFPYRPAITPLLAERRRPLNIGRGARREGEAGGYEGSSHGR